MILWKLFGFLLFYDVARCMDTLEACAKNSHTRVSYGLALRKCMRRRAPRALLQCPSREAERARIAPRPRRATFPLRGCDFFVHEGALDLLFLRRKSRSALEHQGEAKKGAHSRIVSLRF